MVALLLAVVVQGPRSSARQMICDVSLDWGQSCAESWKAAAAAAAPLVSCSKLES